VKECESKNGIRFYSLELFVCVIEFSEYPHIWKFRHCDLVITQFHILDEVWIEKGTGIMEVTINQGFSISEGNLQWFDEMAWHIERGVSQSRHVPTQGPHVYVNIAHA
jgi:hypothetical protein